MARTFRNRRHVPKHTRVLDNGRVLFRGEYVDRYNVTFRRCYLLVEDKAARKAHYCVNITS